MLQSFFMKEGPSRLPIKDSLTATRFAATACASLFHDAPDNPVEYRKPLFERLSLTPATEPLNREATLQANFLEIIQAREIELPVQDRSPYWLNGTKYNQMEIIGTVSQFTDHHDAPMPKTTIPPAQDVERFINAVLAEPEPTTVDRQFELLLDITDNNVTGAANLGMLATRYITRFGDYRAYPELKLDGKVYTPETPDEEVDNMLARWNEKVSKFEVHSDSPKNDGMGDGYYFWTHVYAALALGDEGINAKAMQKLVERGTELMIWAKYKIAGRKGDILPHFEASHLGRAIGLSLASKDQYQ